MYSKFFTIKTKIISKLNLLNSYLPFQVKAKILLPTLMVAAIAVPAGAIALSHVFQANPSGAVDGTEEVQNIPHATSAMPSPFVDQNFYDRVEAEFKTEFPDETVDPSGLSDTQLAKIKTIEWYDYGKPDVDQVSNVSGIEKLTGLTTFWTTYSKITSIDVSHNIALTRLAVQHAQLTSLDISKNTALKELSLQEGNQLASIDISKNTDLENLNLWGNRLTSLDISKNPMLKDINIAWNNFTSIDFSNHPSLVGLTAGFNNSLVSVDVSGCPQFWALDVSNNPQLKILDVSNDPQMDHFFLTWRDAPVLEWLNLSNDQLTSLDVSEKTALKYLDVSNNKLKSLNISKNSNLTELNIYANQLSSLDLRQNNNLESLRADNILLRTNIVGTQSGNKKNFDLSKLQFIGDNAGVYNNTIPNTENYTFDETNRVLSVNNLAGTGGYAQIIATSADAHADYKLQLPKVYKLHYNLNGGTSSAIADSECESMDGGCSVNVTKEAPRRDGFVFLGWSISSTATTAQYQAGDNFALSDPNTEQTLYAVWIAEGPVPLTTYYLSYDANGGAGVPDTQECKSNTGSCNFDISKTTPLNPGYYFLGWSKDSTSKKAEYHPGETFATSEIKNVLYAVWEQAGPGPTPTPTGTLSWKHGRDHVKGSKDNAVFNIDYPLSDFKELKLNDKTLEKDKDYTITTPAQMASADNANNNSKNSSYFSVNDNPTSTTITIKGEYLDTLNPNTYNIVASFSQDDINTTINIIKSDSPTPVPVPGTSGDTGTPNTGEGEHQANPAIVTLCILIPLLAAALTFVSYKIFKPKRKSPLEYYTYKG